MLDEKDWQCGWEDARRRQLTAGLDATPAQRLEWLEEMLALAYRSGALPRKIARVGGVRSKAEAFAKNEEEMLLGMLAMTPAQRVEDVELLRKRLYFIRSGASELPPFAMVARIVRRGDEPEGG